MGMTAAWSSPPLPSVAETPVRHHHSCLSLSTPLLEYLCGIVRGRTPSLGKSAARGTTKAETTIRDNKPGPDAGGGTDDDDDDDDDDDARRRRTVVLSVGSGTGLVERLLWEKITASAGGTWSGGDGATCTSGRRREKRQEWANAAGIEEEDGDGDGGVAVEARYDSPGLVHAGREAAAMELTSRPTVRKGSSAGFNREAEEEGGKRNIHSERRRRVQLYGIEVPNVSSSPQARIPAPGAAKGMSVSLNAYLPPTHRITVNGTWDILTPSDLLELLVVDRARAGGEAEPEAEVEADWGSEYEHEHGHNPKRGSPPQELQEHTTQSKQYHPQQSYQDDLNNDDDDDDDDEAIDVVLMFIYPRQPSLVRQYMDTYAPSSSYPRSNNPEHTTKPSLANLTLKNVRLRSVIWAGPRSDWDEHYAEVFSTEWTSRREGKWDVIVRWGGGGGDSEEDDSRVLDVGVGVGDGEGVAVAMRVD